MISVCILTKNSRETLPKTLDSVRSFREVLILDNGSTDDTLEIARKYKNVTIHTSPFLGFGALRNLASQKARFDWILALDSDEILSDKLLQEIHGLQLERGTVYSLNRHNFYEGRQIKGCGWDKDRVARLYHRKDTAYDTAAVHEKVICEELTKKDLEGVLLHTPYRSISDFLAKMEHYSTLFAQQHQGKRKSSFTKAFFHGAFAFLRSYFFQKGIFLGKEGFIISFYNGSTTFFKYLKLKENNQCCQLKGSALKPAKGASPSGHPCSLL